MDPLLLMAGYAVALVALSLLGGWLPSVLLTHTRLQGSMSVIAGLVLGIALYQLLPHSLKLFEGEEATGTALWWTMLGIVFLVLLLRVFQFHQHDFTSEAHDHGHAPQEGERRSLSWLGIALGMSLHTTVEGMALGTSVRAVGGAYGGSALLGAGVFLAIALHKPLDSLSITATMRQAHLSRRARTAVNVGFAMVCPAAAFVAFWGVGSLAPGNEPIVGRALAFSAGAFLCISLSDLLPEIHFHRHDRGKLSLCFLTGVGLAYALHLVERSAAHGG